ncbi:MAG: sulfurtransferase [Armatimonadetes bacterium]|nr:sulfurtransferase [Armatimonadota bacterium]
MSNLQELRSQHLVETEWLAAQIAAGSPHLRVVDMRGYVKTHTEPNGYQTADYLGARAEYLESHIPGAVYFDWTSDIVDENDPVPAQIAGVEKLAQLFAKNGIDNDTLIVAYDAHPASQLATRLWWVMKYLGNSNVRILNGGWAKWLKEGRATMAEVPALPFATFTPNLQKAWHTTAEEIVENLGSPRIRLIDARDEGQYTGEIRRGKYGGHIPGAKHLPREALFTPENTFRFAEAIAEIVEREGVGREERVVAYCNGGVAATSVLFALSMLGYSDLSNYDGSWNEWGQRDDLPHEVG